MTDGVEAHRGLRPWPTLTGLLLIFVHFRLGAELGFGVKFGGGLQHDLRYIGPGELRFWLSHALLAVTGVLALGYGIQPRVAPLLRSLGQRLDRIDPRHWHLIGLAFFALLFALAQLGRRHLLLDLPITDDENAVRFGARVLASGNLMVPALEPAGSFTDLFLFERGGQVASMDFPGTLLFAALAELSGLQSILYAMASAATGVAVAATAGRVLGRRAAVLAGLVWLVSPMVLTLSMTTHAHVFSRLCVAVALLAYAGLVTRREDESYWQRALLLGLCAGAGFTARPAEVASLLLLPGFHLVWRAARGEREGFAIVGLALVGALGPLLFFAWYNDQLTGSPFTQARRADGALSDGITRPGTPLLERFGGHGAFNLLMLAVWFLGPLGLPLAWLGVTRRRPVSAVFAGAIAVALGVTLLHDNVGIHAVGPIHYSETAIPLTLLVVLGVERLSMLASRHAVEPAWPGYMLAGYAVGAMGAFMLTYSADLRGQAEYQAMPFRYLSSLGVHNAVVVAPPPAMIDGLHGGRMHSSWVLQFPHPDPGLRDDVVFARFDADVDALLARFPDRDVFRLVYPTNGAVMDLVFIGGPSGKSAAAIPDETAGSTRKDS